MTYIDNYDYPGSKQFHDQLVVIVNAPTNKKPRLFAEYCLTIVDTKNNHKLLLRDAAYSIAGAMMIKELDEPLFEELTGLAGELELPAEHIDGDPEEGWARLVQLIQEYASKHADQA